MERDWIDVAVIIVAAIIALILLYRLLRFLIQRFQGKPEECNKADFVTDPDGKTKTREAVESEKEILWREEENFQKEEEKASALYSRGSSLESRGRVKEALAVYDKCALEFSETDAGTDAKISAEQLRKRVK